LLQLKLLEKRSVKSLSYISLFLDDSEIIQSEQKAARDCNLKDAITSILSTMKMDEEHGNKYLQIGEIMHRRISKQEGRKDSGYTDSTKDSDINNNIYNNNHDFIIGLLLTETAPSIVSLFSVAKRAIPSVQVARTPSDKKTEFIKTNKNTLNSNKRTGFFNFKDPPTTQADINMIAAMIANLIYDTESFMEFLEIPSIHWAFFHSFNIGSMMPKQD
jgi:hypothetical protein